MMLFDTVTIPARERADAVSAVMLGATLSTTLEHHDPTEVWLRIEEWGVGPVRLAHVATSGMDTTRTGRQTSSDEAPTIALSLGVGHGGVIEQHGEEVATSSATLSLVELTRPYRSRIPPRTNGWSAKIPLLELGLPYGILAKARHGVARSPVHTVFAHHLQDLERQADRLDGSMSTALLGTATVALARALISSAAADERYAVEALADTLLLRVQAFIRARLTDPHLTPEAIAAAHHVSVRHLYKTFSAADLRLEQWIIWLRLEGARRDLAGPQARHRTIAGVARHWCFPNASHFTHRFREAYGVTPRDWQALHRAEQAAAAH